MIILIVDVDIAVYGSVFASVWRLWTLWSVYTSPLFLSVIVVIAPVRVIFKLLLSSSSISRWLHPASNDKNIIRASTQQILFFINPSKSMIFASRRNYRFYRHSAFSKKKSIKSIKTYPNRNYRFFVLERLSVIRAIPPKRLTAALVSVRKNRFSCVRYV